MKTPLRALETRGALEWEPERYGTSVLGAPLEVVKPKRPADLLVMAGIHGDESDTSVVLSATLRSIKRSHLEAFVVLSANPDGIARGTHGNARGVDLNRNWPTSNWSPEPPCQRWTLDGPRVVQMSSGDEPASEPETVNLLALIENTGCSRILTIHSALACVDAPPTSRIADWLAARLELERVVDIGYPTPGSMGTWGAETGVEVVTLELPIRAIEDLRQWAFDALVEVLSGAWDG